MAEYVGILPALSSNDHSLFETRIYRGVYFWDNSGKNEKKRGLRQGGKEGFKTSAHIPLMAHTPDAKKSSRCLIFLGKFCLFCSSVALLTLINYPTIMYAKCLISAI
jgi:hypothetical protein